MGKNITFQQNYVIFVNFPIIVTFTFAGEVWRIPPTLLGYFAYRKSQNRPKLSIFTSSPVCERFALEVLEAYHPNL